MLRDVLGVLWFAVLLCAAHGILVVARFVVWMSRFRPDKAELLPKEFISEHPRLEYHFPIDSGRLR